MQHIPRARGRPKERLRLSPTVRSRLSKLSRDKRKPEARRRAQAVLERGSGKSMGAIARDAGVDRATVHRWVVAFRERGLRSVEQAKPRGRPHDYQRRRIVRLFERTRSKSARGMGRGDEWTARKFVRYASMTWREGAEGLTIRKMRRLLREAGFVHNGTTWERPPTAKLRVKARRIDALKATGALPERKTRLR